MLSELDPPHESLAALAAVEHFVGADVVRVHLAAVDEAAAAVGADELLGALVADGPVLVHVPLRERLLAVRAHDGLVFGVVTGVVHAQVRLHLALVPGPTLQNRGGCG